MKKESWVEIEDNNRVKEGFELKKFKEDFRRQVEKDTWGNGLPMVYMNDDGWMVHHWSDGRIDMIKKLE